MAFMPRGQSRSVPDPMGDAYDAMLRRVRTVRPVPVQAEVRREEPRDAFLQNPVFEAGEGPEPAHDLVFRPDERPVRPLLIESPARSRPDPRRTEVFRRGADGKLHPVDGWTTTGPFDVERWLDNIDWLGAGRDLARIAAGGLAGLGAPGLASRLGATGVTGAGITAADGLTLGGGVYLSGDAALEELQPTQRPEFR